MDSEESDQELPCHTIQQIGVSMTQETEPGMTQKTKVSMEQEI